jgi:periplasmic protein TonB
MGVQKGFGMTGRQGWLQSACFLLSILIAAPCCAQSKAVSEWRQQIFRQIMAHLQYPAGVCGKNVDTDVVFTVDRTGKLTSNKLAGAPGIRAFDQAALEIIQNAQPFPPAPPDVADSDLQFIVPLSFKDNKGSAEEIGRRCEAMRSESRLPNVMRSICRGC